MALLFDEIRATRDMLDYGFAVGKVRVLETRTLDRSAYERLLDAPSFAEQRRIISESVYGRFLEDARTAEDVERGLDEALAEFYGFLDEAGLPEPVVRFFRLRWDFANLKSAIKARTLGVSTEGLISPHGSLTADRFDDDLTKLPAPLGPLAAELMGDDAETLSLAQIDAAVDKAQFAALAETAREAKSRFLVEVAALLSDVANTKTLLRAKAAGQPPAAVRNMLVPGGTVAEKQLMALYALPPADLAVALERLPSVLAGDEGLSDASVIDVATDNALMRVLRRARRGAVGPEPVIAYVLAREAEVQALRVVLVGKMAGLDDETLRARLRDSYR